MKYRRWIASFPCIISLRRDVQAAHTEKNGASSKGSDASCVPLSIELHDELDGRKPLPNGEMGNKRMPDGRYLFEHYYRLSLKAFADGFYARWMEIQGGKA